MVEGSVSDAVDTHIEAWCISWRSKCCVRMVPISCLQTEAPYNCALCWRQTWK